MEMQFSSNLFDFCPPATGAGAPAQQVGVKLPWQAKANGDADSGGFAEIMAALTRMPTEDVHASLGDLEWLAARADGGEGIPLIDLSQSDGKGHPLSAMMKGGPGNGIPFPLWQTVAAPPEGGTAVTVAAGDGNTVLANAGAALSNVEADLSVSDALVLEPSEGKATAGKEQALTQQAQGVALPRDAGVAGHDRSAPLADPAGGDGRPWGAAPGKNAMEGEFKADEAQLAALKVSAQRSGGRGEQEQALQGRFTAEAVTAAEGKAVDPRAVSKEGTDKPVQAALHRSQPSVAATERDAGNAPAEEDRSGRDRDGAAQRAMQFQKGEGKPVAAEPFVPPNGPGSGSAGGSAGFPTAAPTGDTITSPEHRPGGLDGTTGLKADGGTDAPPLPREVQTDVMRQIVQRMTLHTGGRQSMMQIQLKPDVLGQLRMQISTENQQVTIRMVAANASVKQIIEQNMHVLRAELQQQGLQIQKVEVVVAQENKDTWQDAQHSAEFRQSRHREGQQGRSRNHPGNNAAGLTEGLDKEIPARMRSVGGASGEVDFFA